MEPQNASDYNSLLGDAKYTQVELSDGSDEGLVESGPMMDIAS